MDAELTSLPNVSPPITRSSLRRYALPVCVLIAGALAIWLFLGTSWNTGSAAGWNAPTPLDPNRAISTIKKLCDYGPRVSGSRGMELQQQWLKGQFDALGGSVQWEEFPIRHPVNGQTVNLKNMIISFGPDTKERLLVCAHYDTRPFPDMDLKNKKGKFVGANDGASGPALMIELAHAFKEKAPDIGVDLVLFDAEEFVFKNEDQYFLGSSHFARSYLVRDAAAPSYRTGVLVDMIADKNLELYYEENSFKMANSTMNQIWSIARDMKLREFVPKSGHYVKDDHLPLNEIANIPVCDIIDFDYPSRGRKTNYWHTEQDTPDKCSGDSVCKVAAVLLRWIGEQAKSK